MLAFLLAWGGRHFNTSGLPGLRGQAVGWPADGRDERDRYSGREGCSGRPRADRLPLLGAPNDHQGRQSRSGNHSHPTGSSENLPGYFFFFFTVMFKLA